ncbi:hypothetical protein ACOSQ3_024210 [Xanthoceras sorbifolium]
MNGFVINSDAALYSDGNQVGLRVVIRDNNGAVMLSIAKRVEACYFPEIAKVVAIQYGINLAVETGLLPAMVVFDSLSIIDLILFRLPIRSKVGLIIEDIFD